MLANTGEVSRDARCLVAISVPALAILLLNAAGLGVSGGG